MKKFFQKLRMDAKFAKAGEGHKLTEDTRTYRPQSHQPPPNIRTRPMTSSQTQAGAAALARHEERSKQPKIVKPSVGMAARIRTSSQDSNSRPATAETSAGATNRDKQDNTSAVENSIKFHSPFTEEIIARSDLKNHMRENLILRLSESPMEASSLMIQTLTSNQEKKSNAVSTIHKYLDNMINNPNEEKYRKIRKNNRVFSEKVASVEGAEEFLEAVGFQKTLEEEEIFFVMESVDVAKLEEAKDILSSAEAMEFRLYRDTKILIPTGAEPSRFSLPDEFYKLTSSEVKREQDKRTEDVELNQQLRTKATREAGKTTYTYNYAVIRVKFPDERLLQGTFRSRETIDEVKSFVRQNINVEWAVFDLKTAVGELLNDDTATLLACKLAPAAVINLIWNEEIRAEILQEQGIHLALRSHENLPHTGSVN